MTKKTFRSKGEHSEGEKVNFPRMCLACRSVKSKKDLIRLVRTASGNVEVDITGKTSGRGAYLCPAPVCLEQGTKKARLEKALRASVEPGNIKQLEETFKTLAGNKITLRRTDGE